MSEKDQIEQIDDAHSERLWQPVFRVVFKNKREIVACNLLDTHSAAYIVAKEEAAKFAAREAGKPITERRVVEWFGVRNIDAPAPSQQRMRPIDSRLVSIDTLGKEIAREISRQRGASPAEHGLEVLEVTRVLMEQIAYRDFQLYREDCALPFLLGGIQAVHGGLRIKVEDADMLRSFFLGQADDLIQTHEIAEVAEAKKIASTTLPGLPTTSIAHCFAGLYWETEEQWKKPLGDKLKWLKACVTIPGQQGKIETHWDPVGLGAALVRKKDIKIKSVRSRFQTNHLLKPYLPAWRDYEDEYFPGE